jgi:hypothetical protein
MRKDSLRWQKECLVKAKTLIDRYDIGAAARAASARGRALTAPEWEGFRFDRRTGAMSRKKLIFDGKRYAYA